jgi:hypothetical protein
LIGVGGTGFPTLRQHLEAPELVAGIEGASGHEKENDEIVDGHLRDPRTSIASGPTGLTREK